MINEDFSEKEIIVEFERLCDVFTDNVTPQGAQDLMEAIWQFPWLENQIGKDFFTIIQMARKV